MHAQIHTHTLLYMNTLIDIQYSGLFSLMISFSFSSFPHLEFYLETHEPYYMGSDFGELTKLSNLVF